MKDQDQIRNDERERLAGTVQRSQAAYDRVVLVLSGVVSGIMFNFLARIIGRVPLQAVWALWAAAVLALLAVVVVLVSHYSSVRAALRAIEQLDGREVGRGRFGGRWASVVPHLNVISGLAALLSATAAVTFMLSNLHGGEL